MNKTTIGFKVEWNMSKVILAFLGGVLLVAGGILVYALVIQGAVGGAIAGGCIGGGGALCAMSISIRSLPNELVCIDNQYLYIHKKSIELNQIQKVDCKNKILIIMPKQGKAIKQGYVKNSQECAKYIMSVLNKSI